MHLLNFPKFYITIVFDFSWDECNTQEKLGGGGGKQDACNDVKMVNSLIMLGLCKSFFKQRAEEPHRVSLYIGK